MDAAGVVGRLGESTWQSDSPSARGFPGANFPEISNGSNGKFLCLSIFIESSCARPCRPPSHSTPTDQVAVQSVRAVRDRRTQSGGPVRARRRDASSAASHPAGAPAAEPPARLMPDQALREDHRGAVHPARRLRPRGRPSPRLSLHLRAHAQELAPDLKTHMQGPASGWTLPEWWDV